MEEELDPSADYIKAFNNGYQLAKYEPELSAKLGLQKNDRSEQFHAFMAGKKEFDAEILKWQKDFSRGGISREDRNLNQKM